MLLLSDRRFAAATIAFGALLGLLAAWILSAELMRPSATDAVRSESGAPDWEPIARRQWKAKWAARLGLLRGDLWQDYAVVLAEPVLGAAEGGAKRLPPRDLANLRDAVHWTLALSPHEARAWLLSAAALAAQEGPADPRVMQSIKMSYYTGLNETAIIPERLLLAAQSAAVNDPELHSLIEREITTILAHKPELKPAISAAYRVASTEFKALVDGATRDSAKSDRPRR
jgi:hypothetical protein